MERLRIVEVIEHCKRYTEMVEAHSSRMQLEETPIGESGFMKRYWEHRQVAEWLEELKKLKDAEENGMLKMLPCRIDDEMWAIRRYRGVLTVQKGFVSEMFFTKEMKLMIVVKHVARGVFGEKVFLTREEAEQALKQMGE